MAPPTADQGQLGTVFIICAFLSAILVGFSTIQGYLYFRNFQKDPRWLKCLIGVIWILDGLHISLILASVHHTFVTHFNDPSIFHSFPNTSLAFDIASIMGTASMGLVLAFHSYRVRLVTPNRVLQWMCFLVTGARNTLLMLLAILSCMAVANRAWTTSSGSPSVGGTQFLSGWTGALLLATVALSTLSDVNGTIFVSVSLWKHRKEKLTSTRHLVTKMILYTVQTGACRALFMFSILLSVIFAPINISWMVLVILGPRVYSNSLLTTLNTRVNLTSSNVLDSKGAPIYYVESDLESIHFDGSATVATRPSQGEKPYSHEQLQQEIEKGRRVSTDSDMIGGMKRQPKLDMTIISLSGSTPPVSPIVDLREGLLDPGEIPLPGDELPVADGRIEEDHCPNALRLHPDLSVERVVFNGRGRFFTFNASNIPGPSNFSPPTSCLNPSRFSDALSGSIPSRASSHGTWEDAGDGEALLLQDMQSRDVRFLFVGDYPIDGESQAQGEENRRGMIMANHRVTRAHDLHHTPFSERSWTWGMDSAKPSNISRTRWTRTDDRVALRFVDVEAAYTFRKVFHNVER